MLYWKRERFSKTPGKLNSCTYKANVSGHKNKNEIEISKIKKTQMYGPRFQGRKFQNYNKNSSQFLQFINWINFY